MKETQDAMMERAIVELEGVYTSAINFEIPFFFREHNEDFKLDPTIMFR